MENECPIGHKYSLFLQSLGKRNIQHVASSLIKQGVIKQVLLADCDQELIIAEREHSGSKSICYKLLRPLSEARARGNASVVMLEDEEEEEEEDGEGEEEGEERENKCLWPILTELPLEVQAYRHVESYGPKGLNNSVSYTLACKPHLPVLSHTHFQSTPRKGCGFVCLFVVMDDSLLQDFVVNFGHDLDIQTNRWLCKNMIRKNKVVTTLIPCLLIL